MTLENISSTKVHGGWHKQFTHTSSVLNCSMRFAVYMPPQASESNKVPVLYWLSGLTCTDENFMQKASAFRKAAELGIAIIAPDTSPRGEDVPDDPDGAYDFGLGAGFYIDATQSPWDKHYKMYSYITEELPKIIADNFDVSDQCSISGHSMGGHGALTIGLKNSDKFKSISAFSPICNPSNIPWGIKAFSNYIGDDRAEWLKHDASELLRSQGSTLPILVDQGSADNFLAEQLSPESLLDAAKASNSDLTLRMQTGYDHSYFFIQSFIEDHIEFHAKHLKA